MSAALLLRSLRYQTPAQALWRAQRLATWWALLEGGFYGALADPASLVPPPRTAPSPRLLRARLRPDLAARTAEDAAKDAFTFLHLRREHPAWDEPDVPRLWRFRLNAFPFAWDMAADDPDAYGPELARLATDWVHQNPPRRCDAWHPFVVAERLINLCGTADVWAPHAPPEVARSLVTQARILRATLERDIGGNHIIRELTALVVAGRAFGERGMATRALDRLLAHARRQILPDGGHIERSVSYHLEVMVDLAEVRSLLRNGGAAGRLDEMLARMAPFAVSLTHPDGVPAMFNDAWTPSVPAADLLEVLGLRPAARASFPDSGYHVLEGPDGRLVVDTGPPSPRHLPAHAHCDLGAVEISVGGVRAIVNCGTGDYESGEWRDWWRSTAAHSTVEVDGLDQSEVWHAFRMARRATPTEVVMTPDSVSVAHDGYARSGVVHRRTVSLRGRGWVIEDELLGSGRHRVRSHLHLGPDVRPLRKLFRAGDAKLRIEPVGELPVHLAEARPGRPEYWQATDLGRRQPGRALVCEGSLELPATIGWVITPC